MKRAGIITKTLARERRRRKQPLEVILTLKMNFGDTPADAVTLIDERRLPLVGSVFENRDRIAREFVRVLVKAGARQPRVMGRMFGRRGERSR